MRVLLTVSNWPGHYLCMVPLAWALRAAGHDVLVACPPQQAGPVAATGLMPAAVLDAPDMMESARLSYCVQTLAAPDRAAGRPLPLHPVTGRPLESLGECEELLRDFRIRSIAAVQRSYRSAVEFAERWRPDLVLHDLMAVEGALIGALHEVPAVYVSPGLIGTVEDDPDLDLVGADPLSCFETHGVEWSRDRIAYAVDPSPDAAPPPIKGLRIPMRYVPYNGAQDALPMLFDASRDGARRVCVVWGNSATGIFGADIPALRHAVESAARQGAEVLLTAGADQVERLGALPPNVRVLRNFPLELLLPGCDLLVHHGSANCLMNGIAAGVPQLSLALNSDALLYGRRLDPTGAVRTLPGLEASAEEIDRALTAVLADPRYAEAAGRLKEGVAQAPPPARVADLLIRLARTGTLSEAEPATARENA